MIVIISIIVLITIIGCIDDTRTPTGYKIKSWPGGSGELQVENGLDQDAIIILSRENNKDDTIASVYIRSRDSYTMANLPSGRYNIFFALGKDWDNDRKKFSTLYEYAKFDDILELRSGFEDAYIATLQPVVGGNATTEEISEDKFPNLN